MDSDSVIARASSPTGSSSGSYDVETQGLLRNRLLILFATGVFASVTYYLNDIFVLHRKDDIVQGLYTPWFDTLSWIHPISFAVGIVLVWLCQKSMRRLYWVGFIIMAFNVLLLIFSFSVFSPDTAPLFILALMLLVYAAFIPVPMRFQLALVVMAIVAYPAFQILGVNTCPVIEQFWAGHGGFSQFQEHIFSTMVNIAILGALTCFINRTLYSMRRKLMKAKRLGNYLIKEKIGEGGMSKVYIAEHTMIQRPTAIKVMEVVQNDPSQSFSRFEREVQLSAMLTHPNTITIYDYGRTSDNTFYYAMEFLEGMDLQRLVEKFGPLPPERVVNILQQVCGSLSEAHSRDVIHRDIKPSNIFLTRRGGLYDYVKVLDFGLAKQIKSDGDSDITKAGALFGTPRYVAPESIHGTDKVDARADIYNLGAVAYFMLTGQPLFASSSDVELIADHVKTVPPRPSEISELTIPPELDDLVMKCLEKKPQNRFQSSAELSCCLDEIQFASPWSQHEARDWWRLHLNLDDSIHVCPVTGRVVTPDEVRNRRFAPAQGQISRQNVERRL